MGWLKKNPFESAAAAVRHLVELVASQGDESGSPLSLLDREFLAKEMSQAEPVPEDLRRRVNQLILNILEESKWDESYWDPKGFSNTLQWAGDSSHPNIVAITEEVFSAINRAKPHGWKLAKDRILVVLCGLLVVFAMFAIGIGMSFWFGWK